MKDKSKKNPVLTSPWKIGMLVALLLVVVGFGTGYFMVRVYDIELAWIEGSLLKWEVDSFAFFKEMYPLAAGVLIVSLISYFVVASAVRRYRCFLNSGQDYRRLVQLADSIDDLTNPAQIARLKNYPELQGVLRSYGDQIREISSQLNDQQSQVDHRSVDLEMEIDTLLQGEATQDSLVEDRWWTPLYRKVEIYIQESQKNINELKMKVHESKTALGRVALSTGRIVEQIGGTVDEYPEIQRAVGDLNSLMENLNQDGDGKQGESSRSNKSHLKAVVTEMENTLHKLEDGGKVLNEFSEENNGIALNIALMAAKGEASEHDLAQFAEKVRSTADRFNRLSTTFTSMAQGLLGTCYSLKEKLDIDTGSDAGGNDKMQSSISSIAKVLDERCTQLQERICYIGSEIHDTQDLVNRSIKSITGEESCKEQPDSDPDLSMEEDNGEMVLERSGDTGEGVPDEKLVVDHGRFWGKDEGVGEDLVSFAKPESDGFSLDDMAETPIKESEIDQRSKEENPEHVDGFEEPESTEKMESDDILTMDPESEVEEKEYVIPSEEESSLEGEPSMEPDIPTSPAVEEPGEASVGPGTEEAWGDAAQHKWFKIDIDKEEETADVVSEEIEVRETTDAASEEIEVGETADVASEEIEVGETADAASEEIEVDETADVAATGQIEPHVSGDTGQKQPHTEESVTGEVEDDEPIFDLYELGAVEYVEETITQG